MKLRHFRASPSALLKHVQPQDHFLYLCILYVCTFKGKKQPSWYQLFPTSGKIKRRVLEVTESQAAAKKKHSRKTSN